MNKIELEKFLRMVENQSPSSFVRIGVMNLISDIRGQVFWIVNEGGFLSWKKQITALWWGAILYDRKLIEDIWGYEFNSSWDRFKIPIKNLKELFLILEDDNGDVFESNLDRELKEELCEEILEWIMDTPIISHYDRGVLRTSYKCTTIEVESWKKKQREFSTIYIQRFFELLWHNAVLQKILSNRAITIFSKGDLDRSHTDDWYEIWQNIKSALKIVHKI